MRPAERCGEATVPSWNSRMAGGNGNWHPHCEVYAICDVHARPTPNVMVFRYAIGAGAPGCRDGGRAGSPRPGALLGCVAGTVTGSPCPGRVRDGINKIETAPQGPRLTPQPDRCATIRVRTGCARQSTHWDHRFDRRQTLPDTIARKRKVLPSRPSAPCCSSTHSSSS